MPALIKAVNRSSLTTTTLPGFTTRRVKSSPAQYKPPRGDIPALPRMGTRSGELPQPQVTAAPTPTPSPVHIGRWGGQRGRDTAPRGGKGRGEHGGVEARGTHWGRGGTLWSGHGTYGVLQLPRGHWGPHHRTLRPPGAAPRGPEPCGGGRAVSPHPQEAAARFPWHTRHNTDPPIASPRCQDASPALAPSGPQRPPGASRVSTVPIPVPKPPGAGGGLSSPFSHALPRAPRQTPALPRLGGTLTCCTRSRTCPPGTSAS